jgi:hypothetical protein
VISRTLAIVVLLGLGSYLIVPPVQQAANATINNVVEEVRKRFNPRYALLDEKGESASSSQDGQGISLAFDGATDTYWATTEAQPRIEVELPAAVDVGAIVLYAGVQGQPNAFRTPAKLEISSADSDAKATIEIKPGLERQDHLFELPATSRVVIRVLASRGDETLPLAISEIELFARE